MRRIVAESDAAAARGWQTRSVNLNIETDPQGHPLNGAPFATSAPTVGVPLEMRDQLGPRRGSSSAERSGDANVARRSSGIDAHTWGGVRQQGRHDVDAGE